METGSVTFHKSNLVERIAINKDKEIVKRIMKTKTEDHPNLEQQLRDHMEAVDSAERAETRAEMQAQKDAAKAVKQDKEERKAAFAELEEQGAELVTSNQNNADLEDDFWWKCKSAFV